MPIFTTNNRAVATAPSFASVAALTRPEDAEPDSLGSDPRAITDGVLDPRRQIAAALFGSPAPRERIERYRILRLLGEGAMGVVYEGWDEELERSVALKLVRRSACEDGDARLRFRREALALAKFAHPNVVTVYELGEHEDQLFIAMELVPGPDLRTWLQEAPRSWQVCLDVFVQAGRALEAAHRSRLIHRDFKPANCILADDGRLRVLDFGLARGVSNRDAICESTRREPAGEALDASLTATGALVGTPAYMAPEQLQGLHVDALSDQFAFCVALYEALVGVRPFRGSTPYTLLTNIRGQQLQTDGPSTAPAALVDIVRRGLLVEPAERWPDMGALVAALERFPGRRRRRRITTGVLGLLGVGLGASLLWPSEPPCTDLPPAAVWSAEQRSQVRSAMRSEHDPTEAVWKTLDQAANGWLDRWSEIRLGACRSARVDRRTTETTHARQLACLERHAHTARALTAGLIDDDRAWEHGPEVAQSLPVLAHCADAEGLLRIDDPPPSIATEIAQIRATLNDSRSAWTRADHEAAVRLVDSAWQRARVLDNPAIRGEVGHQRGWLYQHSAGGSAEQILVAALADAEIARDDLTAADIAIELVAATTSQDRPLAGDRWRTLAKAKIDRAHADPTREARLALFSADLASLEGDHDRAERDSRRGLELYASTLGPDHLSYAVTLSARARILERIDPTEAARAHDAGVEATRDRVGEFHQLLGNALLNRGLFRFDTGDDEGAGQDFDAALSVLERTPTQSHLIATARMARVQLESMSGPLSLQALEHAVAPLLQLPADDPQRLDAAAWKAAFLLRLGNPEAALAEYHHVIETMQARADNLPDELALLQSNAAECLVELERWEEAKRRFESSLETLQSVVDPTDSRLAYPLAGLGLVHLHRGDSALARDAFERAVSLAAPSDELALAKIRWGLSQALRGLDPHSYRSVELARAAADGFEHLGEEGADQLHAIETWLRANEPQPQKPKQNQ